MEQSTKESIQIHHVGAFLLLLTLAIIRPEGFFPGIGLPVGPLCLLAASTIFLKKVHTTLGFAHFWARYRMPLILITFYQLLCIISLVNNTYRYADLTEFFRWGLVFIAGQMLLPLCIFTFLLPQKSSGLNHPSSAVKLILAGLGIMLVPISALIQVYFPDVAALTVPYFVGGDISDLKEPIRGLLATSTDLGAISAILCWTAVALAWQMARDRCKVAAFFALCSILFAFAGISSESRNFILFMAVATVTVLVAKVWLLNKSLLAPTLLSLASLFFALAYTFPPGLLLKLGKLIPYFEKVRTDTEIYIADFFPYISAESLGQRARVWESAIKLIADNPFIGISNGGFRLADECFCHEGNTHNILLQSAIDAGFLGVVVMCLLLSYLIIKSAHEKWLLAFILGVSATLMVDNFTDHSYAWIVVVSFAGVVLGRFQRS